MSKTIQKVRKVELILYASYVLSVSRPSAVEMHIVLEVEPIVKRKGLKLQLALAIDSVLGFQHGISMVNARRYIDRDVMRKFRIRDSTKIELEDWILAVQAVRDDRVGHFVRQSKSHNAPIEERLINIIDSIQPSSNQDKSSSPYV